MAKNLIFFLIITGFLLNGSFLFCDTEILLVKSMNKVDRIFADELTRLQDLAESQEVLSGNWEIIKPVLTGKENALYWYALPDGSYYTSAKDKVDANLSDREYFPRLLTGESVVGFPIKGKTSGKKSVVVAVPVLQAGEVTAILGTSFYLDQLWDELKNDIEIPENYDFYAIHVKGLTMFDLETKDHLLDNILEQSSETLVKAVRSMLESTEGIVRYEWNGKEKTAQYITSPVTGWRYVISYF